MGTTATWQYSSSEVNLKGFKKCCIYDAADGTDNDMLWNDSEWNVNVKNECEEDEVTAYEDGHSITKIKTSDTDLNRQIQYLVCNIYINGKIFFVRRNFIRVLSWI